LAVIARMYNREGKVLWEKQIAADAKANTVKPLFDVPAPEGVDGAYFLKLELPGGTPNIYWLTTKEKDYSSLSQLPASKPTFTVAYESTDNHYTCKVQLENGNQISFFNRIKVIDKTTGERILPVHYSDNYITLMPGDKREVSLQFTTDLSKDRIQIVSDSWTADRMIATEK
jgi:mannosylglycoprotein endo-beta-mannosidase